MAGDWASWVVYGVPLAVVHGLVEAGGLFGLAVIDRDLVVQAAWPADGPYAKYTGCSIADAGELAAATDAVREVTATGAPLIPERQVVTLVEAFVPVQDAAGETVAAGHLWVGPSLVDGPARSARQHLRAMVEMSPVLVYMLGPDGQADYFNQTWLDFTGSTLPEQLGYGWAGGMHPDDAEGAAAAFLPALAERRPYEVRYRLRHHSGEYRSMLDQGSPAFGPRRQFEGYIGAATDVTAIETVRQELAVSVAELQRQQSRADLVADLSRRLAQQLDPRATMQEVCEAVVPALASMCEVLVAGESGLDRVTYLPERSSGVVEARNIRPLPSDHPIALTLRTAEPLLLPGDRSMEWAFGPADDPLSSRAAGAVAGVVVPLRARGAVIGVLALGSRAGDHQWSDADLPFLVDLGDRVALAIDNARLFEAERHNAHTLQLDLLPRVGPLHEHLRVAARYLPSRTGGMVGGDWYDAAVLADGDVRMTIGDVMGTGVEAAALMGRIRTAVHAFSLVQPRPERVLQLVDDLMLDFADVRFATALHATVGSDGHFRWASAGHLPPLLVPGAGPPRYLEQITTPPLGIGMRRPAANQMQPMASGDSVLLFTDGLVERRRRDIDGGLRALLDAAGAADRSEPERLADHCIEVMTADGPEDDIAVLVAQYL